MKRFEVRNRVKRVPSSAVTPASPFDSSSQEKGKEARPVGVVNGDGDVEPRASTFSRKAWLAGSCCRAISCRRKGSQNSQSNPRACAGKLQSRYTPSSPWLDRTTIQ